VSLFLNRKIGEIFVNMGIMTKEVNDFVAYKQTGIETVDLNNYQFNGNEKELIPKEVAKTLECVPLEKEGNKLKVAVINAVNKNLIKDIEEKTGHELTAVFADADQVNSALEKMYSLERNKSGEIKLSPVKSQSVLYNISDNKNNVKPSKNNDIQKNI
jgi:type IV pilus assembly protein PilB